LTAPLVNDELRKLAAARMAAESPDHTLQATALVHIDEAVTRLAASELSAAAVVKLHFFAGLTPDGAADVLSVSRATAYQQWTCARAVLRLALRGEDRGSVG
jgi:hypothetical protein